MKTIYGLIVIVAISTISFVAFADDDNDLARELLLKGEIVSFESLLPAIRQHGDWHILEIELEQEHGSVLYEVELLDQQGRVHKLNFDAKTGKELLDLKNGEE